MIDTSNVQVVYPTATTASTQKPPLLALELQVSDGTMITCKTDLDSIVPRMLAVFDKAITATQVGMEYCLSHLCRSQWWVFSGSTASHKVHAECAVACCCMHQTSLLVCFFMVCLCTLDLTPERMGMSWHDSRLTRVRVC